ncbi:MAG: 50S ribosomal protein L3 [Patescibacteria group bacterium]
MSQIFLPDGRVVPVTIVLVEGDFSGDLEGKEVVVVGKSKGAGFTGVMKRHGFHGTQATHGQSDRARAPGASSSGTDLGRVLKGTRRSGRHGNKRVTLKNLKIHSADSQSKTLKISGPLPGARNSRIIIEVLE